MHAASYVFGSEGIVNQAGGWNTGIAFLFGLLSVQWTVSYANSRHAISLRFMIDDRKSNIWEILLGRVTDSLP